MAVEPNLRVAPRLATGQLALPIANTGDGSERAGSPRFQQEQGPTVGRNRAMPWSAMVVIYGVP